jgi:hypothetical protein
VDYFNLFVHKRSPFVRVLSYPPTNPHHQPIYLRSVSKLLSHQQLDLVCAFFPHQILCVLKPQCKGNSRTIAVLTATGTDCIHVF